jgi:hypothetical protein
MPNASISESAMIRDRQSAFNQREQRSMRCPERQIQTQFRQHFENAAEKMHVLYGLKPESKVR